MTTPLRDALTQRINQVGPAQPDVEALVGLGEQVLRRRRLTAVLAGTVAVVLAITIGVVVALGGRADRSQEPSNLPPTQGTNHADTDGAAPTRQIVYSEHKAGVVPGHTVHFGDHVVETGNNHVHLDVTDDGFLYTDRGAVWFSDGGTPDRVGTPGCASSSNGEFGNYANRVVMTANSGSTAAWFDCATLVVFDTSSRHVVARRPVRFCREFCELVEVTSDYVYIDRGVYAGWPRRDYRFDLRTDRLRASTPQGYAEDVRSHPRGLILGHHWQSARPVAEGWQLRFAAVGSRLVPMVSMNDRDRATTAFDTATGRVLRLRLPAGYPRRDDSFAIFEWLDDDTVALFGGPADILTCRLSTGRCVLAVPGPDDADTWRIVPNFPLPG